MRRERKMQLRGIAINHIMAQWQEGAVGFDEIFAQFRYETKATDSEMTRLALLIEEECVKYLRAKYVSAKQLKIPPIRGLCQRLYDLEDKHWDTKLLITRLPEFNDIWNSWIKYYKDLIYDWGISFYESLATGGMSYLALKKRIRNAHDIYMMIDDGERGQAYRWDDVEDRLMLWLKIKFNKVKGELQNFVEDRQNIHTAPVNEQTDATLKQLFAVVVPEGQRTFAEINAEWIRLHCSDYMVLADVRSWASKSMISEEEDWLYRRTLQHLWAKIKDYSDAVRDELVKRLYEECRDALGMCAQGHIARLTNVLVGFDAAFKAPVSLQDRMADIARQESTEEEKRAAATLVLAEYKVAEPERAAWLDAF